MATLLDNKLVPKVKALLTKFGTNATFRVKTSGGVYSTSTSKLLSAPVYTDIIWKITPPQPYSFGLLDGDLIQSGDLFTLIAAQGITFTPVNTVMPVTFGGKTWSIVNFAPLYSGDLICAYELHLTHGPGGAGG